jgi:DNA polymerase-3 subunit gamma/tau
VKQIADQLRRIADAEQIQIDDPALMLIARAGDGSMRDAQSALDQVIAFAGSRITAEDVSTVLGLVRRDLLLDLADAVTREDGPAVFDLAARAVEAGYDLRLVIRELARLSRDLLVVSIDPSRLNDQEIAAEAERERLQTLAAKFSIEDLMRAFEVLTKAEYEIRGSMQPRYHLEMALVRWIHLRKLVPLSELIQGLEKGAPPRGPLSSAAVDLDRASGTRDAGSAVRTVPQERPSNSSTVRTIEARRESSTALSGSRETDNGPRSGQSDLSESAASGGLKDAFLEEIRKAKKFFYGTVIAQAQRLDVEASRIAIAFAPQHRALRLQLDQSRPWLEQIASRLAGRKMSVVGIEGGAGAPKPDAESHAGTPSSDQDRQTELRQTELRQQALADSGVQAMLDVFAAEIREVEEM